MEEHEKLALLFCSSLLKSHATLCRKVVIQLLRGRGPKAVLKKADVLEASKRELGRVINSNEYSKVSPHII